MKLTRKDIKRLQKILEDYDTLFIVVTQGETLYSYVEGDSETVVLSMAKAMEDNDEIEDAIWRTGETFYLHKRQLEKKELPN
jgi:hypothetical protein